METFFVNTVAEESVGSKPFRHHHNAELLRRYGMTCCVPSGEQSWMVQAKVMQYRAMHKQTDRRRRRGRDRKTLQPWAHGGGKGREKGEKHTEKEAIQRRRRIACCASGERETDRERERDRQTERERETSC